MLCRRRRDGHRCSLSCKCGRVYWFNAKNILPLSFSYGNGEGFHWMTLRQRYPKTKRCWKGAPAPPVSSKTISYEWSRMIATNGEFCVKSHLSLLVRSASPFATPSWPAPWAKKKLKASMEAVFLHGVFCWQGGVFLYSEYRTLWIFKLGSRESKFWFYWMLMVFVW